LWLTSSGGDWSKYFIFSNWLGLKDGWNELIFDKSDFINMNGESWNNKLNRIKIRIIPNENTNVTFTDFRYDVNNDWLTGSKGYIQDDTINFKEGSQGLKLVTNNNEHGVNIKNTINKDFSNMNNIVVWAYVDDASELGYIRLMISSKFEF